MYCFHCFVLILLFQCSVSAEKESPRLRYSYDQLELLHDRGSIVGSNFGAAVAISSKYLLVGSIGDGENRYKRSGSVSVYSTSKWKLLEKLTPLSRGSSYQFGTSVAISASEHTAIIGSPGGKKLINGFSTNCGIVHIFDIDKATGHYKEIIELYPEDGQQYDEFGRVVAIYSKLVLVGAAYHDDGRGAVYMFELQGGTWKQTSILSSALNGAIYFGHSLAIDSSTIAIAALHGNNGTEHSSVFIFERNDKVPTWLQTARIYPSNSDPGQEFGVSLAVNNRILAVGARYYSHVEDKGGAVYIFEKDSALHAWSESSVLVPSKAQPLGFFGDTVALTRDILAVGSFGYTSPSPTIVGAVYVYDRGQSSVFSESAILLASHGSNNDFFSKSLVVYEKIVIVGASGDDLDALNSGSVYHFDLTKSYITSTKDGEEERRDHESLIVAVSLLLPFVVFSLCCVYYPGCQKPRRRLLKKYFGISSGNHKKRRRSRDIGSMEHSPVRLDDSISGYEHGEGRREFLQGDQSSPIDNPMLGDIETVSFSADSNLETVPFQNERYVDEKLQNDLIMSSPKSYLDKPKMNDIDLFI